MFIPSIISLYKDITDGINCRFAEQCLVLPQSKKGGIKLKSKLLFRANTKMKQKRKKRD
jgi:hypothetical protein